MRSDCSTVEKHALLIQEIAGELASALLTPGAELAKESVDALPAVKKIPVASEL